MMLIPDRLKSNFFNIPGWHTKRKIIVFESDDWGSIRIPSKETYNYLLKKGYHIEQTPYGKDCLESNDDLTTLMDVLSSVKNKKDQYPIFTLNNIVANPDFEKIRQASFTDYYYEIFTETYKKYPHHNKSFDLLLEGMRKHLFRPQLHGREHLNIGRWMNSIKKRQSETIDLFNYNLYGLTAAYSSEDRRDFQRAFDYDKVADNKESCQILKEASIIFKNTWSFGSKSFIAPNFFWDLHIEKCLSDVGIMYLQGQRAQFLSNFNGEYKAIYHYTGQKNKLGQTYLIRNCYFEPVFNPDKDYVDACLKEIATAFFWNKPAIISTHRVNYIGSISSKNKDVGIIKLTKLLKKIIEQWQEVEFISSDELGDLII